MQENPQKNTFSVGFFYVRNCLIRASEKGHRKVTICKEFLKHMQNLEYCTFQKPSAHEKR